LIFDPLDDDGSVLESYSAGLKPVVTFHPK